MKKYLFFIIAGALFSNAYAIHAADIYLGVASGDVRVGNTVTSVVYVNSNNKVINSAEGVITFSADILSVESISLGGSIFSIWIEQPSFSNSAGTISFNGGVPNPGFKGNSGAILRITFKAKKVGTAKLAFTGASVYANDGLGTNITSARRGVSITVTSTQQTETAPVTPAPLTEPLKNSLAIHSKTHPDQTKWYSNNTPEFTWVLPNGALEVRTLMSQSAMGVPMVSYTPAISEKKVDELPDGIYYFSIRVRNARGWSETSRFIFRIDTKPPEPFTIKFVNGKETNNPQPTVLFDTTDTLSGVDYYKIKIGAGDFFSLSGTEVVKGIPYTLPLQLPGKRTILVQAFDRAGNYTMATEEFVIKALESPTITDYPKELQSGEILTVVIPLAALAMVFVTLLWYGWHTFASFRKKVKKEVREAEQAIHKVFDLLKEDIREQIMMLEKTKTKRQLTEEEEKIIKRLKKHLDDAEKFVRKELQDIEKEVR